MRDRIAVAEFMDTSGQADSSMICQHDLEVQSSVAGPCVSLAYMSKVSGNVIELRVSRGYVYFGSVYGL